MPLCVCMFSQCTDSIKGTEKLLLCDVDVVEKSQPINMAEGSRLGGW